VVGPCGRLVWPASRWLLAGSAWLVVAGGQCAIERSMRCVRAVHAPPLVAPRVSDPPSLIVRAIFTPRDRHAAGGYARPMFPPGRIVHLTAIPAHPGTAVASWASWSPSWSAFRASVIGRDDLAPGGAQALTTRLLLPHAVSDHFPWHIIDALTGAIDNHQ